MSQSYIVYCPMGHFTSLISGEPDYADQAAKSVAALIKMGKNVQRIDQAEISAGNVLPCNCFRSPK